jgi:hypothetical protein
VIVPANTGREVKRTIAVIKIDEISRRILSVEIFLRCIFKIVEIKLMTTKTEQIPAI